MAQFYLTLPSNSSYFGKQPMNNYKTKLATTLNINREDWEVGLSEIIYPYTWNNLQTNATITIFVSNLHKDPKQYKLKQKTLTLRISYYKDVSSLVDKVNRRFDRALKKMKDKTILDTPYWRLKFEYNPNSGKVYLKGNNHICVKLSGNLASMFGFGSQDAVLGSAKLCPRFKTGYMKMFKDPDEDDDEDDEEELRKILKGDVMADVHEGLTCLYVYSSIVESQLVGDMKAPLLRVIPVNGQFGHTQTVRYDNIYYLPLSQNWIDTVEVYIRDDIGRLVSFNTGRVTIVLHFRKK